MKMQFVACRRRGFTLTELVVLIGIVALLISLVVPAVQRSRELSRQSQCQHNLKQIGVALSNYEAKFSVFPPAQGISCNNWPDGGCQHTMNWSISILPYLDQASAYNRYNQSVAFYDERNASAIATVISPFICPSTPRSKVSSMNMTAAAISHVVESDPHEASENFIPYGLPASAEGGAIDYVISSGVKASLIEMVFPPTSQIRTRLRKEDGKLKDSWGFGRPSAWLMLTNRGYFHGGTTTISSITDGTSNTTMIFELGGRNSVYHACFKNLDGHPSEAPLFDSLELENQIAFGGGMWADPANGDYFIAGRVNRDGSGEHSGVNLINKSNMRSSAVGGGSYYQGYGCGPYGFHSGGPFVLMCDGSVRRFSENIDAVTLCALVGAQDNLTPGEF